MKINDLSSPIISPQQKLDEVISKVKEVLEMDTYIDEKSNDYFGYEIYCDYRDELGEEDLKKISEADDPRAMFSEIMDEMRYYSEDYYYPELIDKIRKGIGDELYDEFESEIRDWVNEYVYWYMPEEHFNEDVDVIISLDTGDLNYDFTCCNVLNWYGRSEKKLDENSPIRWLAKQQRKLTELNKALRSRGLNQSTDFMKPQIEFSKFTKTTIQELQNACSHMNTLIFLVKMPLFDFFKLKETINDDKELNKSYYFDERKGIHSVTISKDTMCGLYDIWNGGGSVLDIELERDVKIPTKAIFDVWIDGSHCNGRGYDVSDVYGMMSSAWRETLKEIA